MVALYRSAFPPLLLCLASFATGCAPLEPLVETLEIRAHSLDDSERCLVVANPDLRIEALGPFPVSARTGELLAFRTPGQTLTFPDDTQGVEATADDFESRWLGYSDRRTEQAIDVLLWKERVGCELFEDPDAMDPDAMDLYPGPNAGQAIGYSPETGIVLVAGGDESASGESGIAALSSLVFHSGDGQSDPVRPEFGFPEARAYATVTPFGSGLLLAGGEDPLNTDEVDERETRQTAVFYDPELEGFDNDMIELELARTRHAAVVLDSGETLLLGGGRGTAVAVTLLEAISPRTRRTRIGARLRSERLEPVALRLSDGRVLVGGGYGIDREPVTTLEWFSPDGASNVTPACTVPPCELEARHHRAFVAMPGGGALTVGGCAPGPQTDECVEWCGKGFGCPAPEFNGTWIAPDGELTDVWLEPPLAGCPGVTPATPFSPEYVSLAPGSDGSPWLLAFDESLDPPCRTVFRFEPWTDPPSSAPNDVRAVFAPTALDIEDSWPDKRSLLTSLGPDVFVWLTEGDPPRLAGVRAGVRGALSQNETLLGTDPSAPLVPLHLGPDRPPHGAGPRAIYRFDQGRLILEPESGGGRAVRVSITDTRYDDVTLSIGFTTTGPPVLSFDAYEVGGDDCAWPSAPLTPFTVIRRASTITATDGAGRSTTCKNAPANAVTLGFRAGQNSATITSLSVIRD